MNWEIHTILLRVAIRSRREARALQSVLGIERGPRPERVVDTYETGRFAAAERRLQTEDANLLGRLLVERRQCLF